MRKHFISLKTLHKKWFWRHIAYNYVHVAIKTGRVEVHISRGLWQCVFSWTYKTNSVLLKLNYLYYISDIKKILTFLCKMQYPEKASVINRKPKVKRKITIPLLRKHKRNYILDKYWYSSVSNSHEPILFEGRYICISHKVKIHWKLSLYKRPSSFPWGDASDRVKKNFVNSQKSSHDPLGQF